MPDIYEGLEVNNDTGNPLPVSTNLGTNIIQKYITQNIAIINSDQSVTLFTSKADSGYDWYITRFSASGTQNCRAELILTDISGSVYIIDQCEDASVWSSSGDIGTISVNNTDYKEGSGSLAVQCLFSQGGKQSGIIYKTYTTPIDIASYEAMSYWIKPDDINVSIAPYLKDNLGNQYVWPSIIPPDTNWLLYNIGLAEANNIDLSNIQEIGFEINEINLIKSNINLLFDSIKLMEFYGKTVLSCIFVSPYGNVNRTFSPGIKIDNGKYIGIKITNESSSVGTFEGEISGIEVLQT